MNKALLLGTLSALGSTALLACSPAAPSSAGGTGGFSQGGFVNSSAGAANTGGTTSSIPGAGGAEPIFNPIDNQLPTPRNECASAEFKGDLLPSNILFIVDRSGSMNCNLPPTTSSTDCEANPVAADTAAPTKWGVITGTMSSALDELAKVPNTSVGLTFFSNDDACGATSTPNVGLGPLSAPQVDLLKNALANGKPRGGTPFIGATILGFKHLHQTAQAPGNRFVVLVTDGADSCISKYAGAGVSGDVVDQLLNVEIPKARSVNIRTFVIGAPGSETARGLLSKIASNGGSERAAGCDHDSDAPAPGTACHFDMTESSDFAKDLADTLKSITGQAALTCDFDVPQVDKDGKPVDKSSLNVDYYKGSVTTDKVELYRDDTKACDAGADGWQYVPDSSETKIRVCGALCEAIRTDTKPQVVVSVGCKARVR